MLQKYFNHKMFLGKKNKNKYEAPILYRSLDKT
jgi:hypothetical protein